ncbi:NAD-dependent protein deacetylase [Marinospirillum alkaliphilum]|uniref:NAD-dependent protein deacetylase n=1 Tax=Marinospirillum alkaliphilum DSM 21637 TaxID=1122209 RepID=A0A1K1VLI1_9GAMM|nr:NAD-dependent protein deacetylase [Marinospirillum alkaliphilum]SFX25556.1 NAD-dependent protein deacetylase, SIR2 family [Marinospirillum alkaliphilum DSM 21637]
MDKLNASFHQLVDFVTGHHKLLVLTGAGVSTDSGIPDYRDELGQWKRNPPVQHGDFMSQLLTRQRYWARALAGFPLMQQAQPGMAHQALAALEKQGLVHHLITQNVDRLHQKAGSQKVTDLHGRADTVSCQACGYRLMRYAFHQHLERLNPAFVSHQSVAPAPDGDADLERQDFHHFQVVDCPRCRGIIKPDVVFFGDLVPKAIRQAADQALQEADALLVVGSSLMVYSGYRFCQQASKAGKPVAALNLGKTRADPLLSLKVTASVGQVLQALSATLCGEIAGN